MTRNDFEKLNTKHELDDMAADLYGIVADCEGTTEQRFLAGWENASDMLEDGEITTDQEFKYYCLSEVRNMA